MSSQISNKNFIVISDWMINDLGLSSRDLLTYALIYGFSQDNESSFSGSLSYLGQWLNVQANNSLRYLNSLLDKGLILKEERETHSGRRCMYRVTEKGRGPARDTDHIIILPWMIKDLGLKDRELILYALVYGFSRTGSSSFFTGYNSYISKWLKVDKKHVSRYTSSLIEKGLLKREEEDFVIKYRAVIPDTDESKNNSEEFSQKEGGHQFESGITTSEQGYHQFESTCHQIESGGITNLRDNNLILDNLNENTNKISFNNNSNNLIDIDSVVEKINLISKRILSDIENPETIRGLKEAFQYKREKDRQIISKSKLSLNDIQKVLDPLSVEIFRAIEAYVYPDFTEKTKTELEVYFRAEEMLLDIFQKYGELLEQLDNDRIIAIYRESILMLERSYTYENKQINNETGYLIGIIKNNL